MSKDKFLKSDCKCDLAGFRCLEQLDSKKTFRFEKRECDSVPVLMISRQKIGLLLVIVSRHGSTSTG